ncbi:MAG: AAA family ATPase [Ardenticatenaceae bacterium]|nr:AAA family ATPase [Ardenticatenaceae bacterium]
MLQLLLLGPLRVRFRPDGPLQLLTGNRAALLGYLGLQVHTQFQTSRSRLAGILWPDVDEERARHLLSNTLYRLQKQLPELSLHLHTTVETVSLTNLAVDVVTFRQLTRAVSPTDWRTALELYQGDLLEEVDGQWVAGERALLREVYLATLTRTCRHLEQITEANLHEALLLAQRWAQADPLNEQAHTTLMRLYARLGRPAAAQRQYQTLQTLLAEELGLKPSSEADAHYQAVAHQPVATTRQSPPPFIGRQPERHLLLGYLDQLANGQGGCVLIEGEPGIGKTTLLREVERSAVWQHVTAAWGSGKPDNLLPYAPLAEAIQALSRKPLFQASLSTLPPLLRQLLDPLVQPDTTTIAAVKKSAFTADTSQAEALRHILQSWLAHGPLVLLLDDIQWAGPQFWTLLPLLAELTHHRPFLLLLAYRRWELEQDAAAWETLQMLEKAERPFRLRLEGLTLADVEAFATAHTRSADHNPAQLRQLSGGNPLLLQELLLQPNAEAAALAPLLAERLAQLAPTDREALAAAAVLGRDISYSHWCTLLGRPLDRPTLQRLTTSRFVRETDSGYTFQHDLVRLHLYRQIAPDQKERWHHHTAGLLQQAGQPPETIAWHYAQANAPQAAVHFYQRAAERALTLRASQSATWFVAQAAQLARETQLPPSETLALRSLQLQLAHQERPSSERLPEIETLATEAEALRDEEILLRLALIKYDLLSGQGEQQAVEVVQQQILALVEGVGNLPLEIDALQHVAIKLAFIVGDSDRALIYARWSESLAVKLPQRPELLAEAKMIVIGCLLRGRQPAEALRQLAAVKQILDQHPELHHVENDWRYMWAVAAQFTGDWETAHRLHEESLHQHRQTGNFYALTTALYNTANSASNRGAHAQAILYATEMVTLADKQLADDDFQKKLQFRNLLAQCYVQAEEYALALEALAPVHAWLETQAGGAAVVRAWSTSGEIYVGLGDLNAGLAAHRRAVDFGKSIQGVTAAPFLALAEVCLETGHHAEGKRALAEAESRINFSGPSMQVHTYFYTLRYRYSEDLADLERAYEALCTQSERFANPHTQQQYREGFKLHQQVITLHAAQRPPQLEVRLVRSDVPLGRPLREADFVTVHWTVDAGAGDLAILQVDGKAALRRHRLVRLMTEAKAQRATPSFEALARALKVSTRTIERDMKHLMAQGIEPHSRRYQ